MKTTLDIPEDLYRKVKAKSALEGRPVRDVAVQLFRKWVAEGPATTDEQQAPLTTSRPPWFGALRPFVKNARGRHDMKSVRESIARGRARRAPDDR